MYILSKRPVKILVVSSIKCQTRLRDMGQTGEEGQMINLDHPNVHFLPYMVYQGGVSCTYILQRSNNKSPSHGNAWKFPSTLPAKVGGEGILFPWFGVLLIVHIVHVR